MKTLSDQLHELLDNAINQVEDYKDCTGSHNTMHELFDDFILQQFKAEFDFIDFVESNKFDT